MDFILVHGTHVFLWWNQARKRVLKQCGVALIHPSSLLDDHFGRSGMRGRSKEQLFRPSS